MKSLAVGVFSVCLGFISVQAWAQDLKAGFDITEYMASLRRSAWQVDSFYRGTIPMEKNYKRVYRSPVMGLDNKYDIWLSPDNKVMALNLRGTTIHPQSWLENFYCAMIPAQGSLKLTDSFTFDYKFSDAPRAAVHIGWAIGIGALAPDILDKIMFFYSRGTKQLIIEGHSQGGALAFLLTSYLHYKIADGKLPGDLVIKTYSSAGPKPGNLFYAYDYDYITNGGWAYNVVNGPDWVPQTPATIQTVHDFNTINPFAQGPEMLKGQKLPVRMVVNHIYRKLTHPAFKTQRHYERYLGRMAYKQVRRYMPQYKQPRYLHTDEYMCAGTRIVLKPDSVYFKNYPDTGNNIFRHHLFEPYYFQAGRLYGSK